MKQIKQIVRFIGVHNLSLLLSITILLSYMGTRFDYFLSIANLDVLAMGFILEAIMALGMTLVIISGGIDLSVGAVLPFTAICIGLLMGVGVPPWLAVVIGLVIATLVGLLNAAMTIFLRVHPFIVTLAAMLTLKGVNLALTETKTIADFPESFAFLGQGRVLGVPFPLVLFGVLALVIGYCLKNHRYLQQVYFIGGNLRAARVSGIKTNRFLFFIYALSALLAGLAGAIVASQYGNANSTFGQNAELKVITAVVIGGASLSGGSGSIPGTVLGVLFLAIIYNAFVQFDVSTYWEQVVNGVLLLVAVCLGEFFKSRGRRSKHTPGVEENTRDDKSTKTDSC